MKIYATTLAALAVAASTTAASAQTIQVAHAFVESTIMGEMDKRFTDLVTEKTDGKLKFEFFWAGSLATGNEILNLMRDGAIQMGGTAPVYYTSDLPVVSLTNGTPFLFDNVKTAVAFQDTMSRTNPVYLAEYERMGIFPILQHGLANSYLVCTKPVEKFEDLAGLKVRSFGVYLPAAIEALGMVPVTLSTNDTYEGLNRGVVDCVAMSYRDVIAFKYHEVAKFWTNLDFGASSGSVLYVSWKNYKGGGWSPEIVAAFDEATAETMDLAASRIIASQEDAVKEGLAAGITMIDFKDQERVNETVPDMLAIWRERQVAAGLDAAAADEIVAAVREAQASE